MIHGQDMLHLPINPAANATAAALLDFLEQCRALAVAVNRPRLVSISLEVPALDPLAVLESIFEPDERHFYVERPAENFALAGAEAVLGFSSHGEQRFADCQRFIDATLADAIAVGDQAAAFSGPHFFTAYSFFNDTKAGEPFESAGVFIPRWQVALANGRATAVANLVMPPEAQTDLRPLAEKVWRAHQKFARFDYSAERHGHPARDPARMPLDPVDPNGRDARATQPTPPSYRAAVARALELIARGAFQKIVLARAIDIAAPDNEPLHPLRVLNTLRERFTDCYSFSLANGRGQSFIGASPERLLRVRNQRLLTEALAGSARRGASASEDAALGNALLLSEKDLREQRHVLDSIRRRLEPLGLALTHPDRPGLRKLANVQHLHTPIEAALPENVRLLDILARLHPTPAVGGTPRESAIPRIRELEDFPRGLYAGAIGWIDSRGNGEFFVGLRSALIDGAHARLYAGAGIVAGSSPDREYDETEIKFRAILDALLE